MWHGKFLKRKTFKAMDCELVFESMFKEFRGNSHVIFLELCYIDILYDDESIKLHIIDEERSPVISNEQNLFLYR